jgi:hypothetical protein
MLLFRRGAIVETESMVARAAPPLFPSCGAVGVPLWPCFRACSCGPDSSKVEHRMAAITERSRFGYAGMTAVTSISTRAESSIRLVTWTAVMAG